jgi:hypothetical protein
MHAIETDAKLKPAYPNVVDPSEDSLAHEFLGLLAGHEKALVDFAPEAADFSNEFSGTIDQMLEDPDPVRGLGLRPDIATVAVLTARAIQAIPGLIGTLRNGTSVISIATGKVGIVSLISEVLRLCVFGADIKILKNDPIPSDRDRRVPYMVVRDGTLSGHTSQTGNELVVAAFHAERLVVGIAPDPERHLPKALVRAADFHLAIGDIDESAIALVIEAVTGRKPDSTSLAGWTGTISIDDLNLAIHRRRTPDACLKRLNEMRFGPIDIDEDGPRLEELAGYGTAKAWGLALAADLAAYKFGRLAWADIDKGLLLDGPPGVGKTQYAKALARSARVPLIATSVAQWNSANHLSGALKSIKDVFERARKAAPSILFIDELDGISDRANLQGDYVEYWSQIVNLLLELLSGIEDRSGVVVIGATNHSDRIDPAIRRAGRLDRTITIELPDRDDLCAIFRFYLKRDLANCDLMPLALAARGGTGADVEAWVRRARSQARRVDVPFPTSVVFSARANGLLLNLERSANHIDRYCKDDLREAHAATVASNKRMDDNTAIAAGQVAHADDDIVPHLRDIIARIVGIKNLDVDAQIGKDLHIAASADVKIRNVLAIIFPTSFDRIIDYIRINTDEIVGLKEIAEE